MSSEPKAFASLSSGLLARKGAARPAMRPQGFGQIGSAGLEDLGWNDMGFEAPKPAVTPIRDDEHDAFGEEIGNPSLRNPIAALTPVASPVHDQQAEIVGRMGIEEGAVDEEEIDETAEAYDPETDGDVSPLQVKPSERKAENPPVPFPAVAVRHARPRRPRAAPGSKGKAAFTLRLDAARHLKLRLACAVDGRSAQMLVTEALDSLLAAMPELDGMAERAPKKHASK
ncbi:hypothetical protein H9L12_04110 [Sphingomonas rhizophila]|uniref:Uncharacterized protein n=1 Tax=Sphingomonas rhizophila TaxID=2071607 RepID=A0A7G9SD23_9SPHN|nr:hypothetical protein [Sphingomonas rhizophila]QNN65748.1 hypothetical protein H9L12_04110 [Sphingomonas rhizophila]